MKSAWTILNKLGDEAAICAETGCPKVVARLLVNRDVCEKEAVRRFLFPKTEDFYDPFLMKGMNRACDLIVDAIERGKKIRVVGDYDVDGVMSSYILSEGLAAFGADVDVYLPHRVRDGYGINSEIVTKAFEDGTEVIVTCDNGISAFEAAEKAKELGITMIVTDHHEAGEEIPPADVVVDPKQKGCTYPYREICGAVVAAKFIEAIGIKTGKNIKASDYLEYMCLATVCDVVPLADENRAIVSLGMDVLRKTENLGLKALIEVKRIDPADINEYKIGFVLGPCINAAGRIDDAMTALSLLNAKSPQEAQRLALICSDLNDRRKAMSAEALEKAKKIIGIPGDDERVLVVLIEDCHESILGIVAGNIREAYSRPAIVMTYSGELLKGSARGVEGYSLYEALTSCRELLVKYGGHALAAGLSLEKDNLERFKEKINSIWPLKPEEMLPVVRLDAEVPFEMMTIETVEWISRLAPFGAPNDKPLFAERELSVISISYMGKENSSLRFKLKTRAGSFVTAVSFLKAEETVEKLTRLFGKEEVNKAFAGISNSIKITVAYESQINEYRGLCEVQMILRDIYEKC
ncbi:MAG: single-stranded-DNA-specific exonuclease RecJ [Lachnospiraceae bacterium]|nr:single-stranded-DNA-specific exonuclease RecJ [Lachnospiraceae bacterium]